MAQPDSIKPWKLIGQAIDVDQIAQAHPLILGRMGAGMLKGMKPAEREHRLSVEVEHLAVLPGLRKTGQWRPHNREGPMEIDPLSARLPLADQGELVVGPLSVAAPGAVELVGELSRAARKTSRLQQRHRFRQPPGVDQQIQITAAAGGEGVRGLQGQRDALDHQQGDGGLLKQGCQLTGEAGEGQGRHGVLTRQGLDRGHQPGKQRGHQRIAMDHTGQPMAPDGGQQRLAGHGIQLLLKVVGWQLIAASSMVSADLAFPLQHQPHQAPGRRQGCGCQDGVHPDSGARLWDETRPNPASRG